MRTGPLFPNNRPPFTTIYRFWGAFRLTCRLRRRGWHREPKGIIGGWIMRLDLAKSLALIALASCFNAPAALAAPPPVKVAHPMSGGAAPIGAHAFFVGGAPRGFVGGAPRGFAHRGPIDGFVEAGRRGGMERGGFERFGNRGMRDFDRGRGFERGEFRRFADRDRGMRDFDRGRRFERGGDRELARGFDRDFGGRGHAWGRRAGYDLRADRRDLRADRRDVFRDRRDILSDRRDLRRDYASLRTLQPGSPAYNAQLMDIRADRRDLIGDRIDLRNDTRDIRSDQHDINADRSGFLSGLKNSWR